MADLVASYRSVQKESCPETGSVESSPKREESLSIRKEVLLYKQLIRLMMKYACPIWCSAAPDHVRKLQALQSKCPRVATGAHWYIGTRHIHEDLGIPFFADHIRTITESLESKLPGVGNTPVRQLGRYLL
jgi:hypothetical protein